VTVVLVGHLGGIWGRREERRREEVSVNTVVKATSGAAKSPTPSTSWRPPP